MPKKIVKKIRGVFEKVPRSGEWWIQYFDSEGRRRREKAGTKGNAIDLYRKRKLEALTGAKLPEKLRFRVVKFSEIAEDARTYVRTNNSGFKFDEYRLNRLIAEFGNRPAEISIEDLRRWIGEQDWSPATCNRYKTMLSLVYRLGIEHKKVKTNPAKLLKRKREDNERVRFLGQLLPEKTEDEDLKDLKDEEARLRAVVVKDYPAHLPELMIALHTGMRPSEQYALRWDRVDLIRHLISIPKSKNGKARHIPLNTEALGAFTELSKRRSPSGWVFVTMDGERLCGYKHWFGPAVETAGIRDFTWYSLRHTFASRLVMAGVDLRTVAELMGHKTIQMTMRYAHLAPEHNLAAVEKLVSLTSYSAKSEEQPGDKAADTSGPELLISERSATRTATSVKDKALVEVVAAS
ncbi:MAG: site-specific integrase [Acidobacteriia bacterium]|nr:site-specific integrase [Terriglobia bacterium]